MLLRDLRDETNKSLCVFVCVDLSAHSPLGAILTMY